MILIFAPPVAALVVKLSLWTYGYCTQQHLPVWESAWLVVSHFVKMIWNGGVLAIFLYAINYLTSFGIISVASIIALRRLRPARVGAFWSMSVASIIGFSAYEWVEHSLLSGSMQHGPNDMWSLYLFYYPPWALPIAIAIGLLFSVFPVWRPAKHYWLARGKCPKCHYELKGQISNGCPECGWGRAGPPGEP
ncbi:MAG: hypothetical protein L0219_10100 [Phycisphaerales bacterium]|nr:hypothetical protein [Phycisphaerales bacterium]